jgi:hypothetical protein
VLPKPAPAAAASAVSAADSDDDVDMRPAADDDAPPEPLAPREKKQFAAARDEAEGPEADVSCSYNPGQPLLICVLFAMQLDRPDPTDTLRWYDDPCAKVTPLSAAAAPKKKKASKK